MKTPENMFTIAVSPYNNDQAVLLFNHLRPAPDNFEEILRDMNHHPVLKVVSKFGVLVPPDAQRNEFQITTDIEPFLLPDNYSDNADALIHLGGDAGSVTPLDMVATYYSCTLPHRAMVGCEKCMNMETVTSCAAKKWAATYRRRRSSDTDAWTIYGIPEEIRPQLKNRKDIIGGFTYISPRLTLSEGNICLPAPQRHSNPDCCKPIDREPDEHDFSGVAHHSEIATRSVRERIRLKRFEAEVCPTCLAHKGCTDQGYDKRWCRGPYDISEEDATTKILSEYEIPYNDVFLATLLSHHCGELPFRVNRKLAHLSCEIAPMENVLKFGLMYDNAGYFEALELNDLTDLVARLRERTTTPDPLTPHQRAILIELASRQYSPPENGHWHKTSYRSFFIQLRVRKPCYPYNPPSHLNLYFRYNQKKVDRDWEMPYTVNATCLGDIYGHYQSLKTLQKTDHPFRKVYKKIFRG